MHSDVPRRRTLTVLALAVLAVALSGLLAACGSSDKSSSSSSSGSSSTAATQTTAAATEVTAAEKSELLTKAFYTDKVDVDPVVLSSLKIASTPLTSAQQDKLRECMNNTTCDTGTGDLVLGIADSFGDIPWRVQARIEQTAQAIQSGKVGKIIYTNAHFDLQKAQANFRSLLAQKVDIISAYYDFATAMTSLFRQAASQGVVVTSYISPIPHGDGKSDGIQFSEDYTEVANSMADAVKQGHPTPGNAVFFTGTPGNPTGSAWQPTAQKNLEDAGWKVIFKGNTSWTPAGELAGVSAALAKGDKVDAVIYDGAGPTNLIKGFQRAGADVPTIASFSPDNTYYKLWQDIGSPKDQYITDSQTWTGRVAVQAAIQRASGEQVPGEIKLPQPMVSTADAMPLWEPSLKNGAAYLPPTFAGSIIQEFNK